MKSYSRTTLYFLFSILFFNLIPAVFAQDKQSDSRSIFKEIDYESKTWGDWEMGIQVNMVSLSFEPDSATPGKVKSQASILNAGIQPAITWYAPKAYAGLGTFIFTGGTLGGDDVFRFSVGIHLSVFRDWLVIGFSHDLVKIHNGKTTGWFGRIAGKDDFHDPDLKGIFYRENLMVFMGTKFNVSWN